MATISREKGPWKAKSDDNTDLQQKPLPALQPCSVMSHRLSQGQNIMNLSGALKSIFIYSVSMQKTFEHMDVQGVGRNSSIT